MEGVNPGHINLEMARKSLYEELEAIDYYQERIDVAQDATLKCLSEQVI